MISISLHSGPRTALAGLFSEADDSESEIARYRDLGEILVALDGGAIVGHAQIVATEDSGIVELKSLAVQPDRRSQGLGGALVQAALAHCRSSGAQSVVVATAAASIGALKFNQRQGFRIQRVIRDFYVAERGYRPLLIGGIPLLDEVILDIAL